MKKNLLFIAICSFVSLASAGSEVFLAYENLAKKILVDMKTGADVNRDIAELALMGYPIMDLFEVKYPECKEQFAQVKKEDAQMRTMSFDGLESRYHDGLGLFAAPKHCYLGRSMAAHPYMAAALIREKKGGAEEEINEVARRAPKLKERLGL